MSIYTVNGSPVKYDNKWLATNGGTPSSELPPYDSSDAGKALVVNSEGDDVEWQTVGSSVTVDQHYDAASENPQSGTAVAEALQTVPDELPSITGNSNKVLKVNADATGVEWAAESAGATYTAGNGLTLNGTEFSVDTSVVATKNDLASKQDTLTAGTNIQINNNVISATDTTYTAGDGIDITNDTISADVDGTTIGIDATTKKIKLLATIPTVDQTYSASSTNAQSGTAVAEAVASLSVDEVPAVTSSDDGKVLRATYSGGVGSYAWAAASGGTSYTAGTGIDISAQDAISVKIDGSTITTNASGQLVANGGGGGGGGGSGSTYKFVIEQAHTYNLFTYGDFVFTVSLNGNNQQHLCISSSTVSGACISSQRTLYSGSYGSGGDYGISGYVLGCTNYVQYTPTSLSSEVQLFRITDVNTPSHPYVEDFTLFYEKNGSLYVLNIKTFTIYTETIDPDQGTIRTRTMYISIG